MRDEPCLAFDRVSVSYSPGQDILSEASFELEPGSFTFLTGPSGAGKSTVLRLAYLSLRPTTGRIRLFGAETARLAPAALARTRRRIGVVFQDFRLLDHMTVFENAALPLRVAGGVQTRYRDDVAELLNWVGLGDRLDARPQTLSGGEKQRVAIARAVVAKPDLIIADEPTGNVDAEMGERLMRLFAELNKSLKTTVLIATHDPGLVRRHGGAVLRVADGVLARGAIAQREASWDG